MLQNKYYRQREMILESKTKDKKTYRSHCGLSRMIGRNMKILHDVVKVLHEVVKVLHEVVKLLLDDL